MKKRTVLLIALGALIGVCICIAIFAAYPSPSLNATATARAIATRDRPTDEPKPTNTIAPTATTKPTAVVAPTNTPRPTAAPAWRLTLAMYSALTDGIAYTDAVKIIGKEGTEQSSSTFGTTKTVMYAWQNGDGSNMNAMFQNDKMISKAQFGLK